MTIIQTDRIYSIYARTNRKVQWRYSEYCGRWESINRAIEEVKARYTEKVEYRIEGFGGEVIKTGFINE